MLVDKITCEMAMAELKAEAQRIFGKYDIEVSDIRGKYGDTLQVTIKGAKIVEGDGGVNLGTEEARMFQLYARSLDMDPDALGKTFMSGGREFVFTGYKPRNTRYPFTAREVGTNKPYKFGRDIARKFPRVEAVAR